MKCAVHSVSEIFLFVITSIYSSIIYMCVCVCVCVYVYVCVCTCVCVCLLNHFSHVQLRDPLNCSLPGSSVHGILQTRTLEWVAMLSSRGSSQLRDWTCISCVSWVSWGFFSTEPPRKPHICMYIHIERERERERERTIQSYSEQILSVFISG